MLKTFYHQTAKALGIYDGDGRLVMADKIQPLCDSKAYAIPLNPEKWVAEFFASLSIQNLTSIALAL